MTKIVDPWNAFRVAQTAADNMHSPPTNSVSDVDEVKTTLMVSIGVQFNPKVFFFQFWLHMAEPLSSAIYYWRDGPAKFHNQAFAFLRFWAFLITASLG